MSNAPVTAEDLYLYAMDLLEPAEQTRIDDFLPKSPEARVELANVRGDLAMFAFSTEPQEVPTSSRQRLLLQVAREARKAPAAAAVQPAYARTNGSAAASSSSAGTDGVALDTDTYTPAVVAVTVPAPMRLGVQDTETHRGLFALFMPWAGWAVAAGLAISTGVYYQRTGEMNGRIAAAHADAARATEISANAIESSARATETAARAQSVLETLRSPSAQRFVLTAATVKPVPSARVTYLASDGSLVFQGSNMVAVADDKTYELWLIPAGEGAKPIPAGTFKPDARGFASVILPELPKGTVAAAFGVTLEDDGGAKTPTLPILMVGSA